jgi:hypothetical protein
MKKSLFKAISMMLLLLMGSGYLMAQSSPKGSGSVGSLNGLPVATITPSLRILLPTGGAAESYSADFSALNLGTDENAQMFFDENSCNVMSFDVVEGTGTVVINLRKYPGYTESWSVPEWNNWLSTRCERIRESYNAHNFTH